MVFIWASDYLCVKNNLMNFRFHQFNGRFKIWNTVQGWQMQCWGKLIYLGETSFLTPHNSVTPSLQGNIYIRFCTLCVNCLILRPWWTSSFSIVFFLFVKSDYGVWSQEFCIILSFLLVHQARVCCLSLVYFISNIYQTKISTISKLKRTEIKQ